MLEVLAFAVLCLVWGTSWVAIKYSLLGFPPFLGAALRFLAAAVMLAGYLRLRHPKLRTRGNLPLVVLTAVLVYVVDYGLIYWGEQFLSAGVTAIFFATFPIFTGLMSHFLLRKEPFRHNIYLGLAVGFAGVAVIFHQELARTAFEGQILLAVLGVLTGAASGALSSVLVKKHLSTTDPAQLSLQQMIVGSLCLLVVAWLRGEVAQAAWDDRAVLAVLYLALAASALAFTLYYWLLQRITAVSLSLVVYFTPVVAVFFDWLLLNQAIHPQVVLGMLLIFLGVLTSQLHHYRAYRRRKRAREAVEAS